MPIALGASCRMIYFSVHSLSFSLVRARFPKRGPDMKPTHHFPARHPRLGAAFTTLMAILAMWLPAAAAHQTAPSAGLLPSARDETSAVWTGSAAYVFGGRGTGLSLLDEVVRYTPDGTSSVVTHFPFA